MGLAVAKLFIEQGATVIAVARNEAKLKANFDKYFTVDFADLNSVKNLIQTFKEQNIYPNIIVNNSGGPKPCTAMEATVNDYLGAFTQHLLASSLLAQAFVPHMEDYGRIINIVSVSAKVPSDNLASSNAVRAAILSWSKTLANELAAKQITVNSVLPGYTETERLQEVITARATLNAVNDSVIEDKLLTKIPMRRFAKPEEIAAAVLFFASPSASYITGQSLAVDGGYIASI